MTNNTFDIKILDQHWIQNVDDPTDLCSHGHIYLKIGDQILSDKESGSWTLSATALYLLRTIEIDYKADDFGSQILPCCGHLILADNDDHVIMIGCPRGVDWTVRHTADKKTLTPQTSPFFLQSL